MSVVIRLSPAGRKKAHVYKVLVSEKGAKLTGRYIEKLGTYTPGRNAEGKDHLMLDKERFEFWVKKGAVPSSTVAKIVGFHGLPEEHQKTLLEKAKAFLKKRVERAKKAVAAATETPAAT